MFLLIAYVIVLLSSVGTYAIHGSLGALWVPLEYVAIFGLTIGYLVGSNGPRSLKAIFGAIPAALKGDKYNKAVYMDLLAMLFEILAKVRKEGLMSIENDVENPEASPIFSKYPSIQADHHVMEFVCDYLRMMVGGNLNAFEIENLMDIEIETHHAEAHFPAHMVQTTAGAIPAFGIVVAVMGVVNVMGSVGEPPAVLGKMIGGALVGTFLGILLGYGFVGPVATAMGTRAEADSKPFELVKIALLASVRGYPPPVAIEFARKQLFSNLRPSFADLEGELKAAK